jgi:hypothetical protein
MTDRIGKGAPRLLRRELLGASAAALACAGLSPLLRAGAQAPPTPKAARKLIVVLASGGWDQTYALDPKAGASAIDAPAGSVQRFGDSAVLTDPSRPAVAEFFTRYGSLACVLNGVQVRSFVHPDCLKRVLTGSASEITPDFAAITAFELGRELPVPYLALGGQARSGPYAAITGRTGTTNQLTALIDPKAVYPSAATGLPETGVQPSADERELVRKYLDASAARLGALRGQRGYNRARIEDYLASLDRAERLRAFAGATSLGERDYTLDLSVQIPLAVRALTQGLSWAALMQMNNWDTHRDNSQQGPQHQRLFAALLELCAALEREALLDQTLVVVLSEMGRTPRLNNEAGKDHWPVTSALLLGAGVRGGRTLGATGDQLDAQSIDLQTGAPGPSGKQLQASNLVAGVLEAVGVPPERYLPEVEPLRAFMG